MITAGMWDSIWPSDSVLGQAVVLVILGLGIWALRSAMFHLARYQREGACLAELEGRVRRWREGSPEAPQEGAGEVEETAEGPGEPENLEGASPALLDLSELQEGLDRGTLVWQRVRSLEVLASHRGKVDVASLRRQSLERDEATKGWTAPGFVSGLAMLLGIFGTFLGLAAMVQQIQLGLPTAQDAVTSEALQESISHLRTVLGGMKTAFATSIAGMSCALVAGSLDHRLRRRRQAFFERFDRFTEEELLPATVPVFDDEDLLERVTFQLERSFDRLEQIHEHNQRSLAKLTGAQKAFVEIVDEVRTITRGEAARNLDRVVEVLAQTHGAVLEVVGTVPKALALAERQQSESLRRLEAALARRPLSGSFQLAPRQVFWGVSMLITLGCVLYWLGP